MINVKTFAIDGLTQIIYNPIMKNADINKGLPVISWCTGIEPGAQQQIDNLSQHPRLFHHIAVMPDCHQGYGMPIGGVIACDNSIIPNAVGVDIGCGMCAVKTTLQNRDAAFIRKVIALIRSAVPVGFEHHRQKQDISRMPGIPVIGQRMPVVDREYEHALTQIGTLGGGNHFIELQKDSSDFLWIMIHSGSRNIGKQVADYHNRTARIFMEQYKTGIPPAWQLDYLPADSPEGQSYLDEMAYCVAFAFENRKLMMERIQDIIQSVSASTVRFDPMINIAHNYASLEEHFGKKVWIHRKGATSASNGLTGIIPGSQGTNSYIVKGKGNAMSFASCSHGAGRIMGRKEAERKLDFEKEKRFLEERGIVHALRSKHDLDEAAGAYKNISEVMKAQQDLVDIIVELSPAGVIKD